MILNTFFTILFISLIGIFLTIVFLLVEGIIDVSEAIMAEDKYIENLISRLRKMKKDE